MRRLSSVFGNIKLNCLTHYEEKRIIAKYETYLTRSLFYLTTNFDEIGKRDEKRLFYLYLIKVCSIVSTIRFLVNIMWPTPYVRDLTCTGFHYLGDPKLINISFVICGLAGNLGHGAMHQIFNIFGRSRMFYFMNKIKNRRMKYRLNDRFNRKFYRRLNIISISLNKLFLTSWLIFGAVLCCPTIVGYFDNRLNFTLTGIVHSLVYLVWIITFT